jgi:MMP 1-O-methyltransferase
MMDPQLREHAIRAKGFMPPDEGDALYAAAASMAPVGPLLEVGSYCGKSSVYLGAAARVGRSVAFCVDHHHGSEENQVGWEHHDPMVIDPRTGRMDTLPSFRATIEDAGLEDVVVAVVGTSEAVAKWWTTPLAFLFIDGGHGTVPARHDYEKWVPFVKQGGLLAIHDVFLDPRKGGQTPYEEIYRPALAGGRFAEVRELSCESLRVLRRV